MLKEQNKNILFLRKQYLIYNNKDDILTLKDSLQHVFLPKIETGDPTLLSKVTTELITKCLTKEDFELLCKTVNNHPCEQIVGSNLQKVNLQYIKEYYSYYKNISLEERENIEKMLTMYDYSLQMISLNKLLDVVPNLEKPVNELNRKLVLKTNIGRR